MPAVRVVLNRERRSLSAVLNWGAVRGAEMEISGIGEGGCGGGGFPSGVSVISQ